jgi:uncharacterized membrane protein YcaP (DUF421 family)
MARDMLVAQIPLLEKVLRSIAVYLFLVLALRLAGKRELVQQGRTLDGNLRRYLITRRS